MIFLIKIQKMYWLVSQKIFFRMCPMCRTKCVVSSLEIICRNEHLVSHLNVSHTVSQITTHATHLDLVCGCGCVCPCVRTEQGNAFFDLFQVTAL